MIGRDLVAAERETRIHNPAVPTGIFKKRRGMIILSRLNPD
jgi:hypothetical protein